MTKTQLLQTSAKCGVPSASDFTSIPLRNHIRMEFEASVSEVWELVGDLSRFPEYRMGLERVEVKLDEVRRCLVAIDVFEDGCERFSSLQDLGRLSAFAVHVEGEAGVVGEGRLLALGVAAVGAVCVTHRPARARRAGRRLQPD
jgi:hypothetical protein